MQNRIIKLFPGIFILLAVVTGIQSAKAQNATDFKLNEILIVNESNYVDDFGNHSPWIEIFNSSYSPVNLGGCFLTDDLNNLTKYWIPTGDPATLIDPRCYIVFWGDNKPTRGIFHLNFDFAQTKTIALVNANGKDIIDQIDLPQQHTPDITYGRVEATNEWKFLEKSTPASSNDHARKVSSGEKFVEMDPSGLGMTMIAMLVVFSALALLYIIYSNIGRFFMRRARVAKYKETKEARATMVGSETHDEAEMSGEVNAAIAMALYMYQNETHDFENTVLTIKKVSRTYSPWSSKIYTLRKSPR